MDDDSEMSHREFIRANFFSPSEDVPAATPATPTTRRRRRADPEFAALARFARALDSQSENARRAAIFWLADRYLGLKPRDFNR